MVRLTNKNGLGVLNNQPVFIFALYEYRNHNTQSSK